MYELWIENANGEVELMTRVEAKDQAELRWWMKVLGADYGVKV